MYGRVVRLLENFVCNICERCEYKKTNLKNWLHIHCVFGEQNVSEQEIKEYSLCDVCKTEKVNWFCYEFALMEWMAI